MNGLHELIRCTANIVTNLQLPDDGLRKILPSLVDTHRNEEPAIYMLLTHAPLPLLQPLSPLPLQASGFSFLARLSALFGLRSLL